MKSEFLPRAHARKLGELDSSNWKNLASKRNIDRVDPAIRDIVLLLNEKGYITFSSCSGGHAANVHRRFDRHESGYIAFAPPSQVAFTLYLALRRKNRDFGFEAQAAIDDWNGSGTPWETFCTRLYWQLLDHKPAKRKYYDSLFADMKRIISLLPGPNDDQKEVLAGLLGREHLPTGSRIVKSQMRRFSNR